MTYLGQAFDSVLSVLNITIIFTIANDFDGDG